VTVAHYERGIVTVETGSQFEKEKVRLRSAGAPADDNTTTFPCAPVQRRLWFLDRIDPGNPALNVALRWAIDGRIDPDILQKAFSIILNRHEILRTRFVERAGEPVQCVEENVSVRLGVLDLSGMKEADKEGRIVEIGKQEAAAEFQIDVAPLIRATLLLSTRTQAILLITAHHLVFDGWSIGVLAREICSTYQALAEGRGRGSPELPIQYGDYALWQEAMLKSGALDADRDFWLRQLDKLPYFELPTDFPRPDVQSHEGSILSILLPKDLTDRAEQFSRERNATFFTTALTALVAHLGLMTGQHEIVVGTQVAGRDDADLENLIGAFVNTVVLRFDLLRNPSQSALFESVRVTVHEALEHRRLPFERLIELLNPKRDPARTTLISVNMILQRAFAQRLTFGDLTLTGLPSYSPGAQYDINFVLVERAEGWRASCEYNTDLFLEETIQSILRGWEGSIARLVNEPQAMLVEGSFEDAGDKETEMVQPARPVPNAPPR